MKSSEKDYFARGDVPDVAPFTGAWIEIASVPFCIEGTRSLPSRERGLKSLKAAASGLIARSLPSRERGLKFLLLRMHLISPPSLPSRERGLKYSGGFTVQQALESLPSRERGLKS